MPLIVNVSTTAECLRTDCNILGDKIQKIFIAACFRKVLTGKRLAEQHIRKSLPSQSAELCQDECSTEKNFVCEGFNYRLVNAWGHSGRGGKLHGFQMSAHLCILQVERLIPF